MVPATISFTVRPPLWRRWWFISLLVTLISSIVLAFHSYRLKRVRELEMVRSRIATDLHDDIGSSLSYISLLSEVLRQKAGNDHEELSESLKRIAGTARELIDSMSVIVWSINPRRDHVSDLIHRMRRFASDVFSSSGIRLHFTAPESEQSDMAMGADLRRQIFLIFKESINNIARHSVCTEAHVELQIQGGRMVMVVRDNGHGFDPKETSGGPGHGVPNMRARAASIGADLLVLSGPNTGTEIRLSTSLSRRPTLPVGRTPRRKMTT